MVSLGIDVMLDVLCGSLKNSLLGEEVVGTMVINQMRKLELPSARDGMEGKTPMGVAWRGCARAD